MSRTLLIAGGNSGIGLETIRRLRRHDDTRLLCAVRQPGPLAAMDGVDTLRFEATDPASLPAPLPDRLDGFVYFPGTINLKPFHRLTDDDFLLDWQINFLGAIRLLRAALPSLKVPDHASIVLFSTVAVTTGMPFHSSIAAAKGAVEALTRSLAAELAPKIRVNAIAPSLTRTPLASSLLANEQRIEASKMRHPLQEIGDPADVAATVEFLLGEESRFMTGQVLALDGGLSRLRLL